MNSGVGQGEGQGRTRLCGLKHRNTGSPSNKQPAGLAAERERKKNEVLQAAIHSQHAEKKVQQRLESLSCGFSSSPSGFPTSHAAGDGKV